MSDSVGGRCIVLPVSKSVISEEGCLFFFFFFFVLFTRKKVQKTELLTRNSKSKRMGSGTHAGVSALWWGSEKPQRKFNFQSKKPTAQEQLPLE